MRRESEGWAAVGSALDAVPPEELDHRTSDEVWSAKDVLGHLAFWCEEAARVLVEIREGRWDGLDRGPEPGEVDAMNAAALERSRAADLGVVLAAWREGRSRMLEAFGALDEVSPEAAEWFDESGPTHYAEHLPDLERRAAG